MSLPRVAGAALWWAERGVGVVPLRPALGENGRGKLSPIPLLRWQQEGPLRNRKEIMAFWQEVPEAQLAILLEKGLCAIDVDLKHLPGGVAPPDRPIPQGGGYCETTKSGGLHFVFSVEETLDPGRPGRVTGLSGYVDVFAGGLLVTAPSRFPNAERGYELLNQEIRRFPTMEEALRSYAPWLASAWKERRAASPSAGPPERAGSSLPRPPGTVDLRKVEGAIRFLRDHPRARDLFERGVRYPDGVVDRSLTELQLVSILKFQGFSRETIWEIVRLCPHTKSPQDSRGWERFEEHVWSRLK